MKNKKIILSLLIASFAATSAWADLPFRMHRYDSFKALPITEESIVFYGNSITNMNEWWECFGSDQRIVNRGNSGGYTQELIDNIEAITSGHPAKIFVGIGTNDLGTKGLDSPERVGGNIRTLIQLIQKQSPNTEIYIQSILPSENGLRTNEKSRATNAIIKKYCDELGVTYIDLYDTLASICTGDISYDGLHLTAKGYKLWCDQIAPYVGVECTLPLVYKEVNSGMKYSFGMRSTSWGAYDVLPDDILIIGDEMIHGGEWHELLGSPRVKDRGIGWGYGGMWLGQWAKNIRAILAPTSPAHKEAPAAVALYVGVNEGNSDSPVEEVKQKYQAVVDSIREYAPAGKTKLVLMSLMPRTDGKNRERIEAVNSAIREIAAKGKNVEYLDIYNPLSKDGVANPEYITEDYLYSKGYLKVADLLKKATM